MTDPRPPQRLLYAATIFLSAFLLFQVQPVIAKMILPWFGGSAGVWTVCLLFFQVVLLLGYLYAHLLATYAGRAQTYVHRTLLVASLFALPIVPNAAWKPQSAGDPSLRILLLLSVTIGLPYLALSTTSPLLQAWYTWTSARDYAGTYRFYALSNAGSLLALVSYPVAVEPGLSLHNQAIFWSVGYIAFVVMCVAAAWHVGSAPASHDETDTTPPPAASLCILWITLAACSSTLLLAITNHISQNIASVPFLWIVPLSLYLLSFILCFDHPHWYKRGLILRLLGVALGGMAYGLAADFVNAPITVLIPLFCAGLFICCMFCHGELARLKPPAGHLTSFYLSISFGSALGAVFVALVAPRFFRGLWELPIGLGLCALLVLIVLHRDPESLFYRARWHPMWLGLVAIACALWTNLIVTPYHADRHLRVMTRNFYGVLRVADHISTLVLQIEADPEHLFDPPDPRFRELFNGTITHGMQFLGARMRREPTTYYSQHSGVGVAIRAVQAGGPVRIGVIGLGAGTLAAYGRPGDVIHFYDINPLVIQIAKYQFSYLRESQAQIEITAGDARLSLEREQPENFDVLAVDAFSGDSIPVHLLTREAIELYFRHLRRGGVLAIHISNKYVDLEPVVRGAALRLHKEMIVVDNGADDKRGIYASTWVLLTDPDSVMLPELKTAGEVLPRTAKPVHWTDDYSSLLRLLK